MFSWNDTELDYLSMSNEDERVVGFVRAAILPLLARVRSPINWLEVGPGPGTKTARIFQIFVSDQHSRLESMRLLEPSPKWRGYLRKMQKPLFRPNKKSFVILKGIKFETYARREVISPTDPIPNFITFFHILYEKILIDEVIRYLRHRASQTKPLVASIIVESEESDLFQLRKRLESAGCRVPFAAAPEIRRALSKAGFPVKTTTVNRQYCMIPEDSSSGEWLLAFLLGCTRKSVRRMSQAAKFKANLCVRDYINGTPRRGLQVPDVAFTITIV
jgi:hypothetical protein